MVLLTGIRQMLAEQLGYAFGEAQPAAGTEVAAARAPSASVPAAVFMDVFGGLPRMPAEPILKYDEWLERTSGSSK